MRLVVTLVAFGVLATLAVVGCGGGTTPVPPATPTATLDAVQVPPGDISTLLIPSEVSELAGVGQITTKQLDMKSMAAAVDPAQVEHMDSFDSLEFTVGGQSLVLTTIDFDSGAAAADHAVTVFAEMSDLPETIGDESVFVELNAASIGSMVAFRAGEWVVMLHTTQAEGTAPLVDTDLLLTLARMVEERL